MASDGDNHDGVNDLRQTPRRRSDDDWQTAVNVRTFCRRALPRFRNGGRPVAADMSVKHDRTRHVSANLFPDFISKYVGDLKLRKLVGRVF